MCVYLRVCMDVGEWVWAWVCVYVSESGCLCLCVRIYVYAQRACVCARAYYARQGRVPVLHVTLDSLAL